jgi:hypothetical protein
MRMHRGSSKEEAVDRRASEALPLSASPAFPEGLVIDLDFVRGGRVERHQVIVPSGTLLRVALRLAGGAAEGSAVLRGETPVPLDLRLDRAERFTVVSTFSGG